MRFKNGEFILPTFLCSMADDVTTTQASPADGAVFATDDDGTRHYPWVKLVFGPDDTFNKVGSISSNPLPVALSDTDNTALDLVGTNTTDLNNTIGTDGSAGPTKVLSVGGTQATGEIEELRVDSDGHLQVDVLSGGGGVANLISTNNSTTTPLGISGNFTATADDVSSYTSITIFLDSSHDSATDGMTFQFSSDNADWTIADTYTFTYTAADGPRRFQFPVTAQYFRVNYTNGGTGQTTFDLQTILHGNNVLSSVHRLADNVDPDRSAQVTKSAILAQASGSGDFVPVAASATGKLQVAAEIEDGGNSITVDDGGTSLTVDGTVTANPASGTIDTVTTVTAVTDITNTIDSTISGAALTALQLIDDTVYSEDAATPATIVGNAVVMERDDALSAVTPIEGDWIGLRGTAEGALWTQDFNSDQMRADLTTIAGAVATEMQVDVVGALPAGTNAIGKLAANSGVDIGDVDVTSISAGSNLIGDVGLSGARTSGGTTFASSLGTSTLTQIKATAGQLYWLHVINLKASVLYLQIFDLASASVTLGTTTPDLVFPLVTQGDTNGAGFVLSVPNGIAFGTGISWAITTTETGATTASDNEAYLNAGYA